MKFPYQRRGGGGGQATVCTADIAICHRAQNAILLSVSFPVLSQCLLFKCDRDLQAE